MNLDPKKNDKEFEHFCKWIARDNFGPNVFLYSKYNQNGIDIYWTDKGKYDVIQCKQRNEPNPSELITSLENDFSQAKKYFDADLRQFIFATTASLEVTEKKIKRTNGLKESVLDVCNRLSVEYNVDVVSWHWDYLQERVSESQFLSKHLLNREEGADLIDEDFIESQSLMYKGINERQCKLEYYGGQEDIQWYGIFQNLDSPREIYDSVIECISSSFKKSEPVASVIRGDGGSGKSVFLRRLAVDLREKYTIYWLGNNIDPFLCNEFIYDVQKHPESKYIIILEDWYRNIERTGNKIIANQLLNELKRIPNARLIIGDRKDKKKMYDDFVGSSHIYDLHNTENIRLLENIFKKMPEWKEIIPKDELNEIKSATLFIALFVFCYGEYNDKVSLADRYKRIFKSDYSKFLEKKDSFENGFANILYLYANLYSNYGITLSLKTLLDWTCYYSNGFIPSVYLSDNNRLLETSILKKYLHIENLVTKNLGTIQKVRFHHDTMAEQGWATKHELIEIEFDERVINDLIFILKRNKQTFDLNLLYYRLSKQLGEKGKSAAREYLKIEKPENNHNAFCACLDLLKGEEIAKQAARNFLQTEKSYVNFWAFCACLDLLKGEEIAKQAARDFLQTETPYVNYSAFCACLDLLKGEEIAKHAARDFLQTENSHVNKEAFCSCLDLLKGEKLAKDKAEEFLNTNKPYENYQVFCTCLDLLKGEEVSKQAARDYLQTENPHVNKEAFCSCLDLLKGEEVSKHAARDYLQTENPHVNKEAFGSCLVTLDIEAESIALKIVENYTTENWSFVFHSLDILSKTNKHNNLVSKVVSEIIAAKEKDWFKYREVLKIPLFNIPTWVKETEYLISHWNYQIGYKRNNLFSLLNHSYKEFPEKLNKMSIGIIRNWKRDLSAKTKHKAYFTRCLANIDFSSDKILKAEVIKICKEIYDFHEKKPLLLTPNLDEWLKKIATTGEFPKWRFEEQITIEIK